MTNSERNKLSDALDISEEEASRILIEKQKTMTQSEIKYHVKSMCALLDKLKSSDANFADAVAKETVKFIIARHASAESLEELMSYIEDLSDNFLSRALIDNLRNDE